MANVDDRIQPQQLAAFYFDPIFSHFQNLLARISVATSAGLTSHAIAAGQWTIS